MQTKKFVGEVVSSKENVFNGSEGKIIECWELGLLFDETRGLVFNVSKLNEQLYLDVQGVTEGQRVEVEAHAEVRPTGVVRWKLDAIRVLA